MLQRCICYCVISLGWTVIQIFLRRTHTLVGVCRWFSQAEATEDHLNSKICIWFFFLMNWKWLIIITRARKRLCSALGVFYFSNFLDHKHDKAGMHGICTCRFPWSQNAVIYQGVHISSPLWVHLANISANLFVFSTKSVVQLCLTVSEQTCEMKNR